METRLGTRVRGLAVLLAAAVATAPAAVRRESYGVVVIGATPAGIAAAIAAGRAGLHVALVEETPVPGGLLSNGVSRADDAVVESASGVFEDFRRRIANYYLTRMPDDPVVALHRREPRVRHSVAQGQAWEARVAASTYREMLAAVPSVAVFYREVPVAAAVEGNRVRAVTTRDKDGNRHTYRGTVIVDATYEGDVAAFAGVPFRVGREPRSPEEPHAGHIYTDAFCEGAYRLPGAILPGGTGQGDRRIMAYNYRFLVKDYGKADGPHRLASPPPGYDPLRYKWDRNLKPYLPNGKIDVLGINWGNDWAGPNYKFPEASWEERAQIERQYRDYALGYLYFIQTQGGCPHLGLADDEFTDNGNFPYKLYVREARRIDGLYRLTESDMHKDLRGNGIRGPLHKDGVAIGLYEMDSHNVQNMTDRGSRCSGEGAINLTDVTGPYQIPYGVLVPAARDGLLVPVAISATHVAMTSIRMEPVWSALGEAAGEAAALAARGGTAVKDVDVAQIQQRLLAHGGKLFFYRDVHADQPAFSAIQSLSALGGIDGDENYRFHPEWAIRKGELARLLATALDMPVSVTAAHFKDMPRSHPAFKYVETLYDASTELGRPFLPFELRDYLAYPVQKNANALVEPDSQVDGAVFARMVVGALRHRKLRGGLAPAAWADRVPDALDAAASGEFVAGLMARDGGKFNPHATVTRAAACRILAALRRDLRLR